MNLNDKRNAITEWKEAKAALKSGTINYSQYLLIKNKVKPDVCIHAGKKGNSYHKQK